MKGVLFKLYRNFDTVGATLAMTAMLGMTTFQIAGRLSGVPVTWTIEANRYLLIYLVFLGISEATKREAHIGTEFLRSWVSPKIRFYLWLLTQGGFLLFAILMIYSGIAMVKMHYLSHQLTVSFPYNFSVSYVSVILPIGFSFTALRLIEIIWKGILEEKRNRRSGL
jgi:TRAP-type C4-dicarboxylate transport system permease small subunit